MVQRDRSPERVSAFQVQLRPENKFFLRWGSSNTLSCDSWLKSCPENSKGVDVDVDVDVWIYGVGVWHLGSCSGASQELEP